MYSKTMAVSKYMGTSRVARMLHMSVGTVQKLVKEGSLTGYVTTGGHRRISYDSVIKYVQSNNLAINGKIMEEDAKLDVVSICVLTSEKGIPRNLAEIIKAGIFQVVTDPMQLIHAAGEILHIFIDARIEWINWQQLERASANVDYVIFNSGVLNSQTRQNLEGVASFIDADISFEILNGYRLGLKSNNSERKAHSLTYMTQ